MKLEEMINKVHCADCLSFMKDIPDKSIDLVLTDPPYGIGVDVQMKKVANTKPGRAAAFKKDYGTTNWDSKIPEKEVFDEIFRISKNQIIFGGNYFIKYLDNSPCWLVWDKNNGDNKFADCELCWTNFKTAVRKYKYTWNGMIQEDMKNKDYRFHPTQKPVKLIQSILQDYSEENQTILDPFLGSGTTAVACQNLKRNFIGIEIDPKYCEIAKQRLRQKTLF